MLVYMARKRQNFRPVLVRPLTKKPHLWIGVDNKPNKRILLILRGENWRRGPGSNRRIKVLQTFIEEGQTPVFMRVPLL
jgi:hypothetical protein